MDTASQALDWFGFASNAAAAAIGAIAAFIFALWLARIERDKEHRKVADEQRSANVLTISSAINAASLSMEELLNAKAQYIQALLTEAAAVEAVLVPGNGVQEIFEVARLQTTLFREFAPLSFPDYPKSDRFAFIMDEVPSVTGFAHRAASSGPRVLDLIAARNDVLRRYAALSRSTMPTPGDMAYFFPMIISISRALGEAIDDALFFARLLHDQCHYIGLLKFQRPRFRHAKFPADKVALLPSDDYIPTYAGQLKRFGFAPVERVYVPEQAT